MISNKELLDNMTADEKFKIICRIKDFDIQEMAIDIYKTIESSNLDDTSQFIGIGGYQDEYMDEYDVYQLYINSDMLYTFDEWAKAHMKEYDISYEECACLDWELCIIAEEFSQEQKEFIELALQCEVDTISIRAMP